MQKKNLLIHLLLPLAAHALLLSATPVKPVSPSFAGDFAFDAAVRLCEERVADGCTSIARVPSLLRTAFHADFERLLICNGNRLVQNVTCLQPATDTDGMRKYNEQLLSLPLRRGRACVGGCCSDACSRTLWSHLATRDECEQLIARANRIMPAPESHPHHNMYLMLCAASGEVRTTLLFVRLVERMRRAIAHEYGVPMERVLPRSAFLSRLYAPGCEDQTLHADESSYDCFHYSGVLYLSTHGVDFEGGSIRFFTQPAAHIEGGGTEHEHIAVGDMLALEEVAPVIGSAIAFSSGWENPHQVQPLTSGCRYAVPAFFATTCEEVAAPTTSRSGDRDVASPLKDDATRAQALWRTALWPESEDDFRELWIQWHAIFGGL